MAEFLHAGVSVPFILLTEEADEKTVAEIIDGGRWNCVAKSQLDGATLVRTMRNTLALHSLRITINKFRYPFLGTEPLIWITYDSAQFFILRGVALRHRRNQPNP